MVGIGGGKVIDTVKYAATMQGMPMVAVATSLAHDGLASPVSTLVWGSSSPSYGVHIPIAVVVDLDLVARSPAYQIRSGIGDALSDISACADWELSHAINGEPVDGLAMSLARTAAESVLHHPGTITDTDFLATLAQVADSRRRRDGRGRVEPAVQRRLPRDRARAGDAAAGRREPRHRRRTGRVVRDVPAVAARTSRSRPRSSGWWRRSPGTSIPRTPAEIGLTDKEFVDVVAFAPSTRPGRYTILERLDLDTSGLTAAVEEYVDAIG